METISTKHIMLSLQLLSVQTCRTAFFAKELHELGYDIMDEPIDRLVNGMDGWMG